MKEQTPPQNSESQHIPAPLRDWLDRTIQSTFKDSTATQDITQKRNAKILNAILYPLTDSKTKKRTHH